MVIVDAHCHASPHWYEPIESLLFQMDRNGVERALLVQHMGQFNNDYLFECARRYSGRFAVVVLVDALVHTATEKLERLAEQGARGVRLRPDTRSPGDDPLAIWRKVAQLGLPVSCSGTKVDFASGEFADLVQSFPDLPIVLEHMGSINHPDDESAPFPMHRAVFGLSRFANIYIKIHGLGEFCRKNSPLSEPVPFETPIPPLLEMAYDAFGAGRMMWGSDYPPVSGREGYANALSLTMAEFEAKTEIDRELIFGGTAARVFGM